MSNKPDKETIFYAEEMFRKMFGVTMEETDRIPIEWFKQFITSYSASQNSELKKENEELKEIIEYKTNLYEGKYNDAATYVAKIFPDKDPHDQMLIADGIVEANYKLQSTIEEKDKQLKESLLLYQNMCEQISKDQKEIERLKGLIEDAHEAGYNDGTFNNDMTISESWEQFKEANPF